MSDSANDEFVKYLVRYESGNTEVYLVSRMYDKSVTHFMAMIHELRKDFPTVSNDDIEFHTVIYSDWCKGCPVVYAKTKNPPLNESDWKVFKNSPGIGW